MAVSNKKFSYDSLGEITNGGIMTASFPQIRDAIAARMRAIYGNDIDLSTASADGQYINMEALILNNIYRLLDDLYKNINPFTASGQYLDVLCSLTNVTRKSSTQSTAQLYVKNVSGSDQTPTEIDVIDRNNILWVWVNPTDLNGQPMLTIPANSIALLDFICMEAGEVQASGGTYGSLDNVQWDAIDFMNNNGDINRPISVGTFKVYQESDAIVGSPEETDEDLRARRYSYLGSNSTTPQAGLEAALFNLDSIIDVYILNNVSGNAYIAEDGQTIANHDVYIVLRYKDGIDRDILKNTIANIIYNKLTPGILTHKPIGSPIQSGTLGEYTLTLYSGVSTTVHWKICDPENPPIIIEFIINNQYVKGTQGSSGYEESDYEDSIHQQINNYLSNIKINNRLLSSNLQSALLGADLKYNGLNTFYPIAATINGNAEYLAKLSYYKYNTYEFYYKSDDHGFLKIRYIDPTATQLDGVTGLSSTTTTVSFTAASNATYYEIFINDPANTTTANNYDIYLGSTNSSPFTLPATYSVDRIITVISCAEGYKNSDPVQTTIA